MIKLIGVNGAYFFLSFVVIHFILFAPKATKAIWQYNRRHLHYGVWKSLLKLYLHYYRFGQTLIDKVAIKEGFQKEYNFEFDNFERFLKIINGNTGVVLIGAHVGAWETGGVFFGDYSKKINIVMLDAEHQQIKKVMKEEDNNRNFKIIPVNDDPIKVILSIKTALNNGEYVCFNGDRFWDKDSAVKMKFLGGEALFPIGPFRIAQKCRVPVVFYFAMREKNKTYRFIFQEIKCDRTTSEIDLLSEYIKSLEFIVNRYPQQWFNFYKFWN